MQYTIVAQMQYTIVTHSWTLNTEKSIWIYLVGSIVKIFLLTIPSAWQVYREWYFPTIVIAYLYIDMLAKNCPKSSIHYLALACPQRCYTRNLTTILITHYVLQMFPVIEQEGRLRKSFNFHSETIYLKQKVIVSPCDYILE